MSSQDTRAWAIELPILALDNTSIAFRRSLDGRLLINTAENHLAVPKAGELRFKLTRQFQ